MRLTAVILVCAAALAGCGGGDDDAPAPASTTEGGGGKALFASSCGGCHRLADAGTSGRVGPDLDATKPDTATVVRQVTNGGGGMPAFKDSLSKAEIDELAAYVSRVAGD